MRCCGSPTTSTVPEPAHARTPNRELAAQFAALLFKEAFAPLAKAMGFYGDLVVAAAAQSTFRDCGAAVTGPFERAIESATRDAAAR
jgi:hypothetical protein